MLKIKIVYAESRYSRIESIFRMKDELKQNDIELVDLNEDILMIHTPLLTQINERITPEKKPFILIERIDSCDIWPPTRKLLVKENCIGILKNTILHPLELYNEPVCTIHRYFASIINKYAQLEKPKHHEIILTENDLNKIKCIIPYCLDLGKGFDKLVNLTGTIEKDRNMDLNFVGTIKYSKRDQPTLPNWHRQRAVIQANKLKVKKLIVNSKGHKFSYEEFLQQLLNTKICLSPWGIGEHSSRDWEAIYCGALVVKPNSEFVIAYPNIYQNNVTYVPCLPDFSDLEQVVNEILNNWEKYTKIRENARDLLVSMWDNEKRAKEFAKIIFELYEKFV